MKIINKNSSICVLITLLVFSRLIPHPPNFTPIISIAILSSILFQTFLITLMVFLLSMFVSDLIIGLYPNMVFTYVTLMIIGILFYYFFNKISYRNLVLYSFLGSLIFYLITNFFFWINSNIYEHSFNGLIQCYILAIPFFTNTIVSTIFFSFLTLFCVNKIKKYYYKIEDDKITI